MIEPLLPPIHFLGGVGGVVEGLQPKRPGPESPMATRAPCSPVGPGMGAALETSCPVSMSLKASWAPTPPPSPLDVVRCGLRLLGGGGQGGNLRLVSSCLVFPRVPIPILVLSCSLQVYLVPAVFWSCSRCVSLVLSIYSVFCPLFPVGC